MTGEYHEARRFGLPRAREAALDRIARAYADDDIDLSDYERRTADIQSAEHLDELQRIMNDVPDFDVTVLVPPGAGEAAKKPRRSGAPERRVDGGPDPDMHTMFQVLGDRDYGSGDALGGLRIVSLLGDSTVDLRDLQAGETVTLSHLSLLGDLTILVPTGCRVRRQHILLLGDETVREPRKKERRHLHLASDTGDERAPAPQRNFSPGPPPRVVLRGFKLLGDVTIVET
jgi:hypothetical protein